jgi:hypothetical protein
VRWFLTREYLVNLDGVDAVVIEAAGAHLTLRSGRTIYLTAADARELFAALGYDYDAARESAEQERMRVAEFDEPLDEFDEELEEL